MSEGVGVSALKCVFRVLEETFQQNRARLIELDSQIGDGDLGLSMAKGFSAVGKATQDFQGEDVGVFFRQVGMSFVNEAPSTMGTLLGSGFLAAGKALKGKQFFGEVELRIFFTNFAEAVALRGKVKEGDKTAYDIFWALDAHLRKQTAGNVELTRILEDLRRVARQRGDEICSLRAKHGKAAVFREKTEGMADPGAEAAVLFVETFAGELQACLADTNR